MGNEMYLITGAGTGLGKGVAFGLAGRGKRVIAGTETGEQSEWLAREAEQKGLDLQIERLDITDVEDRERALGWEVDVLVNNAGVSLDGSLLDIPEDYLRQQFEVNVIGTILLTQGIARQMAHRGEGRIIFVSSLSGLTADPLLGPYCASKFALESMAESLAKELQGFGVQVQVINPGPYLTGFNDRGFEAYRGWDDDPDRRYFNYEDLAFPYPQLDPQGAIDEMVKVVAGETKRYRNVIPGFLAVFARHRQGKNWSRRSDSDLGKTHPLIKRSRRAEPAMEPKEVGREAFKDLDL